MFIKLTRKDGSPIWLNASFIVTVEPTRGSGAVVVPIGDGLDYEVRESPEAVLALLDGAPVPAVVPVPTTDALTATPDDVSPDDPADATAVPAAGPDASPKAKTAKKTRAKAKASDAAAGEKKPAKPRGRSRKATLDLSDDDVERLKKLAPKSLKKLTNTLVAQFKVADAEATVAALVGRNVISLDQEHVKWSAPEAAASESPVAE